MTYPILDPKKYLENYEAWKHFERRALQSRRDAEDGVAGWDWAQDEVAGLLNAVPNRRKSRDGGVDAWYWTEREEAIPIQVKMHKRRLGSVDLVSFLGGCLSIIVSSFRLSRMGPVGAASLPRSYEFRTVADRSLGVQYTQAVALWADRNSLSRLWPVQMSSHSRFTFSSPRSRNCRKPRACLICPNTGSTVSIRNA